MALSTQITETKPRLDWFAEPLAAIVNLFASQLSESGTGRSDTSGVASDSLPPPTSELPGRPVPIPGEPVDTSHARPVQSPVVPTGAAPSPE
ncbi:hypothetical protein AB0L88_29295 [Saccharopolyspora shandongensis]|uniref:Uncharacterized protein n=1 Tax=Saccharopolyspora shandongensis TaxID=418495 RepID=A0A1H2SIF7_9PSEU|nr:hypothetical protein [Saccharopolyspora shandongensis]SDW30924.1 hypothetical protein SAMN05216215_1002215 [Saccharopolyspora shandongensis]